MLWRHRRLMLFIIALMPRWPTPLTALVKEADLKEIDDVCARRRHDMPIRHLPISSAASMLGASLSSS